MSEKHMSFLNFVKNLLITIWVTIFELSIFHILNSLFNYGMCKSKAQLNGKTAIVTGSNTGIGKETAKDFANRGARVIIACRNIDYGQEAADEIKEQTGNYNVVVKKLDLASLDSIHKFANDINENEDNVNILVNNAGVFMCPHSKTKEGFEMHFGVNYLGHFLLTLLLIEKLNKSASSSHSRIINLTSHLHRLTTIDFDHINMNNNDVKSMNSFLMKLKANDQTQLARILFTQELAKRLKKLNYKVNVYSVHPGLVKTDIFKHLNNKFGFKILNFLFNFGQNFLCTPHQGAQTTIYCAVDEKTEFQSGLYYEECRAVTPSSQARDKNLAKDLWDISCDLVGLQKFKNF